MLESIYLTHLAGSQHTVACIMPPSHSSKEAVIAYFALVASGALFSLAERQGTPSLWRIPKTKPKRWALVSMVPAIVLTFSNRPDQAWIIVLVTAFLVCLGYGFSDYLQNTNRNIPAFLLCFSLGVVVIGLGAWHAWPASPIESHLASSQTQSQEQSQGQTGKPPDNKSSTSTSTSPDDLHVQDEDERRRAIIDHLRQEFVVTHRDQEGAAIAEGAPLPADWENRRLWSIGEHWRIGIPDSIASLTSSQLSRAIRQFTVTLRAVQRKHSGEIANNSNQWWKRNVEAHQRQDFSHDQQRHNQEMQELAELQTKTAQDWENNFRVKARELRDEVLCRIPVQPEPSQDFIEIQAGLAIDRHSVAGSPFGVVADYLDRIASQLSSDSSGGVTTR
jgi:hypothetical protein